MTDRLYYENAYLTAFDAQVTQVSVRDGRQIVTLDRSAFYPTSGGQPFDTGTLNGARVTDVFVDAQGEVWHETDGAFAMGENVHGEIDWLRRFDHMQQHAADHMIAGAIWRMLGGVTIGLHESGDISTIDVQMPDGRTRLSAEEIARVEWDVNRHIQRDVPIRCWFPAPDELAALPLRKKPTVQTHVRVVAIGDDEMVACGGTHPSSAGQLGLVKILSALPARGKVRVGFVAGERALRDYFTCFSAAHAAAQQFSSGVDKLEGNVALLRQRLECAENELRKLRRERMLTQLDALLAEAEPLACGARLAACFIDGDMALVKECASKLIERPDIVALLGVRTDRQMMYVFGRSDNVNINMGALLSEAARALGGKGGGRPDFAQGGGPEGMLAFAAKLLKERLT